MLVWIGIGRRDCEKVIRRRNSVYFFSSSSGRNEKERDGIKRDIWNGWTKNGAPQCMRWAGGRKMDTLCFLEDFLVWLIFCSLFRRAGKKIPTPFNL